MWHSHSHSPSWRMNAHSSRERVPREFTNYGFIMYTQVRMTKFTGANRMLVVRSEIYTAHVRDEYT